MKTFYPKGNSYLLAVSLSLCLLLSATSSFAQISSAGQAAKFGIDGDLTSDERLSGTFTAAGSHDWFKKAGGAGQGLIDTSNSAFLKAQIQAGANIAFSKRMSYAAYTVDDGVTMLDGVYARDYLSFDYTTFMGNGTKNTTSPLDWGTAPEGSMVSDKTDIVDTYVHMRRDGNTIAGSQIGDMVVVMGMTTLATQGDHYVDFEFYKEDISYESTSGRFINSGPAATGGHSVWQFAADGTMLYWGDITISYSFNSSSVKDISIWIWVKQLDYNTIDPKNFDFIPNSFEASASVAGYGYARIKPNGAGVLAAWGVVNTATIAGPLWGTNSKDLGGAGNNYYSESYSAGQFAEAGVNLSLLGIDPAMATEYSPCFPPFSRFVAKSRNSSSFTSALSDFTGPYQFLDLPTVPSSTVDPGHFTCTVNSLTIQPTNHVVGALYKWSTENGNITSTTTDQPSITINQPGTYYLTTAIAEGCATSIDTIVVVSDTTRPVATAGTSSPIVSHDPVTLIGGDPAASNFMTPFGASQGLSWQWDGIAGTPFSASEQSPKTEHAGDYRLILTEARNGCKDTAYARLAVGIVLPVRFTEFSVNADRQKGVNTLYWMVGDAGEVLQFVVEKSTDGIGFSTAAYVFAQKDMAAYYAKDNGSGKVTWYRIKAISHSGSVIYSKTVKVTNDARSSLQGYVDGSGVITLSYSSAQSESVKISLFNMNGERIATTSRSVATGSNTIRLTEITKLVSGVYLVQVEGASSQIVTRIVY